MRSRLFLNFETVAPPKTATKPILLRSGVPPLQQMNGTNGMAITQPNTMFSSPPKRSTRLSTTNMNRLPASPSSPLSSSASSSSPEQSSSPSQLLASGLLRGRTMEDYLICNHSASPERSWVGASRLEGEMRKRSSTSSSTKSRRRRHSSPNANPMFDEQGQHIRSSSATSNNSNDPSNNNGNHDTDNGGGGLSGWVARRLGRRGSTATGTNNSGTQNETKSNGNKNNGNNNGRNGPSASSMMVAVHRGTKCVLKEFSGDELTRQRIEREVAIRGMFTEPVHSNIAPLEAIFFDVAVNKSYIHYRLNEVGNLADWLLEGTPQPWDIQSVFQQLVGTLVYLHSHQIVHRCLSLDNILIGIQGDAQGDVPKPFVTDFGDAVVVPSEILKSARRRVNSSFTIQRGETKQSSSSSHNTHSNITPPSSTTSSSMNTTTPAPLTGDPIYRAPELDRGILRATSASDMWALGVMLYKATFGLHKEPVALGGSSVSIPPHKNARLRSLIKGTFKH